jgi:hypothetical protein
VCKIFLQSLWEFHSCEYFLPRTRYSMQSHTKEEGLVVKLLAANYTVREELQNTLVKDTVVHSTWQPCDVIFCKTFIKTSMHPDSFISQCIRIWTHCWTVYDLYCGFTGNSFFMDIKSHEYEFVSGLWFKSCISATWKLQWVTESASKSYSFGYVAVSIQCHEEVFIL